MEARQPDLCNKAQRIKRNVPSKAVDLVWHLHMRHTRDYWDVFCKTLGKPVHHNPGGEGGGHLHDYKATVEAYKRFLVHPQREFGDIPNAMQN